MPWWSSLMMRHRSYSPSLPNEPDNDYFVMVPRRVIYLVIVILILLLLFIIIIPIIIYSNQSCVASEPDAQPYTDNKNGTTNGTTNGTYPHEELEVLDRSLIPQKYWLTVKLYVPTELIQMTKQEEFTYLANVTILCDVSETRSNFTVLADHMDVVEIISYTSIITDQIYVIEVSATGVERTISVNKTQHDVSSQKLIVFLNEPLLAQRSVRVDFVVRGKINQPPYLSNSSLHTVLDKEPSQNKEQWLTYLLPHMHSIRYLIPCFDESQFRAQFMISVEHPGSMVAISNSPIRRSGNLKDGWVLTDFATTEKINPSKLVIAVGSLELNSQVVKSIIVRIWHSSEQRESIKFAAEQLRLIIPFYETLFGMTLPVTKIEMVVVPDLAADAVGIGAALLAEHNVLFRAGLSPSIQQVHVVKSLAAVVVTQWAGSMVDYDEDWIEASLVHYLKFAVISSVLPGTEGDQWFMADYLESFSEASLSHKGAHIFRMLQQLTNQPSALQLTVNTVLRRKTDFRIGLVDFTNLLPLKGGYSANKITRCLADLLDGMAVLHLNKTAGATAVTNPNTVETCAPSVNGSYKSTFSMLDTTSSFPLSCKQSAAMPIWLRSSTDSEICLTTMAANSTVQLGGNILTSQWLLANQQFRVPYYVQYDATARTIISSALQNEYTKFDTITRAMLIRQSFELMRVDPSRVSMAFDGTKYLNAESSYLPWLVMDQQMIALENLLANNSTLLGLLKVYFDRQTTPFFTLMSGESDAAGYSEIEARQLAWRVACRYGVSSCTNLAMAAFRNMQSDCRTSLTSSACNPITPNLRSPIYCEGIRSGTESDYNWLWIKFSQETASDERVFLLTGLSCSTNNVNIQSLLNSVLLRGASLSLYELGQFIERFSYKSQLLTFMIDSWTTISKKFPKLPQYALSVSRNVVNNQTMTNLAKLIEDKVNHTSNIQPIHDQLETNQKWITSSQDFISEWLSSAGRFRTLSDV